MRHQPIRLLTVILVCVVTAVPIVVVMAHLFADGDEIWQHLAETILWDLIRNTVVLLSGVLLGTTILGVGAAWLVTACEIPARGFFTWALFLPFAFPTYVLGYVALELGGISGPLILQLSRVSGIPAAELPNMQSAFGVILVMSLAFYPYVYLLATAAFRKTGHSGLEVARILGHRPFSAFFRVVLPMARPWISAGLLLVAMETLADFGTVSIFNYDTFTTAIYKAWYGLHSLPAAAQMAAFLLAFSLVLLGTERWARSRKRFFDVSITERPMRRLVLTRFQRWAAFTALSLLLIAGFLLPFVHLCHQTIAHWGAEHNVPYAELVRSTLVAGGAGAFSVTLIAVLLAYAVRSRPGLSPLTTFATAGYALPGSVLAVGVFIPLAWLDNRIYDFSMAWFDYDPGLLLNGTLVTMLAAYMVRFPAVAYQPITAALEKIRPAFDECARSLGHGGFSSMRRIHLPLMTPAIGSALLLVMIDVMKEMPITLMTRPFGWDTLATRIFELTSEGEYARAAMPSLLLVMSGLVPVYLLTRLGKNGK
ncbi:MAG: iron ABC transporter permease [Acidobacteriota bacterium]|nr:iron ABC transporter permease [Acidobacteriota bacterium]